VVVCQTSGVEIVAPLWLLLQQRINIFHIVSHWTPPVPANKETKMAAAPPFVPQISAEQSAGVYPQRNMGSIPHCLLLTMRGA
jgi:hypothetical protein